MGEKVILELPWPPSVNHYYRHVGPRVLISKEGRLYRDAVATRIKLSGIAQFKGDVDLSIQLYPPDNRRRDVDNVLKCVMDTLTIGGLYEDDSQVKQLKIVKLEPMPPDGLAVLMIKDYEKINSQ